MVDLRKKDSEMKGLLGGFQDETYGYQVPYHNGAYHGKVARFRLDTFGDVQVLDLTTTDSELKGFFGGFQDDTYGYLVPYHNGVRFGKVSRFRLDTFCDVPFPYTHLRSHETKAKLVCRLLLENKNDEFKILLKNKHN